MEDKIKKTKQYFLPVRFSKEESEIVKKASEYEGLNMSSFIRRNVLISAREVLKNN